MNYGNVPINIIELLEKRTRLHGGKVYLTTVRVIAGCNGSFFDGLKYSLDCTLTISYLYQGEDDADMVYLPKKGSAMPIIVVELRWNKGADGVIAQIKERNYLEVFEGYGSEVLLIRVSYDEKTKKHERLIPASNEPSAVLARAFGECCEVVD